MQRTIGSRISAQFLRIALNNITGSRIGTTRMEVGCAARSCNYFSTGLTRVSNGDSDRTLQDQCDSPAMLFDLKDSKEGVYGALDVWVAWEQNFPIVSLKRVLLALEKEEQWHRVIQVIKWMLSKGQGKTMGTYQQLIRALDKDLRAEEAHEFWVKKIGHDLHSVPWGFCELMISMYYRNNMLDRLVKLFKGLEAFDRKPPNKCIVQKVADACEMLGSLEEKRRLLEKYKYLLAESNEENDRKSRKLTHKKKKKAE